MKLMADVEREKVDAVAKAAEESERAKASTRAAVSFVLPSRLFGGKVEEENKNEEENGPDSEVNEADGEVNEGENDASGEQVNA